MVENMLVQRKPDPHTTPFLLQYCLHKTKIAFHVKISVANLWLMLTIFENHTFKMATLAIQSAKAYLLGGIVYVKFEFQFTVSLRVLGFYFVNSRIFPSCQADIQTSPGNGHYAGIMEGLTGFRDAISGLEPLVLDVGRVGCGRQFDQQVAAFINREHFAFVFGKVGLICKIKTKLVGIRDLPEVLI